MNNLYSHRPAYVAVIAAVIGLGAAWLSIVHHIEFTIGVKPSVTFCNINQTVSCDAVNASAWSTIAGVPVATFGFLFYAFTLVAGVAALSREKRLSETGFDLMLLPGLFATFASVALLAISSFSIQAVCLLCLIMHGADFAIAFAALKASSGRGLIERLLGLPEAVGRVFRSLIREDVPLTTWAWSGVVSALFASAIVVNAKPTVVGAILLRPQVETAHAAADPVADWQAQPLVQIPVSPGIAAESDFVLGPDNATVTIVEFSDFECPACRMFAGVAERLGAEFSSDVQVVFKNYPLDQECNPGITRPFHLASCYAAEFARCAGEQGEFWKVTHALFGLEPLPREAPRAEHVTRIQAIAGALSLDDVAIEECMAAKRHSAKIRADIGLGDSLGLQGTPLVFANGRRVTQPTYDNLRAIVAAARKK